MDLIVYVESLVSYLFDFSVMRKIDLGYKWICVIIASCIGILILFLIFYFRNFRLNRKTDPLLTEEDIENFRTATEIVEEEPYSYFTEIAQKIPTQDFIPDIIARNRHGIAIFGYNWSDDNSYSLYWLSSSESTPFKVDCGICGRYPFKERSISLSIAESKDKKYKFEKRSTGYYINEEPAELIS